jgi:hypothetical protein
MFASRLELERQEQESCHRKPARHTLDGVAASYVGAAA